MISQVTFPAYSKLQGDIPKLRDAYLKVLQVIAFLSFPVAGLIFVLAPDFTIIFLGERWMPMVPAMQALTIWGAIRSVGNVTELARAVGKPKIGTYVQFIQLILLVILIYPLSIRWGILGTSLAVVFASLVTRIISSYMVIRITLCPVRSFCKPIIFPLIGTIIMVLSVFLMKTRWVTSIGISEFFLHIGFCILIYLSVSYLLSRFLDYQIQSIIKESSKLLKGEK